MSAADNPAGNTRPGVGEPDLTGDYRQSEFYPDGDPATVDEEPLDPDLLVGDVVDPDEGLRSATGASPAGTTPGTADSATLDHDQLQHVMEEALTERNEYLEALRRLQAEFENYRKRSQREQAEAGTRATGRLMTELLPVFDTVDLARSHEGEEANPLASQLMSILTKEGLERLDPTGEAFDPNHHEAVMHAEGEGEAGPVVAEVFRAGWKWKGKVIRPAMVRVEG